MMDYRQINFILIQPMTPQVAIIVCLGVTPDSSSNFLSSIPSSSGMLGETEDVVDFLKSDKNGNIATCSGGGITWPL